MPTIRELNDLARTAMGVASRVVMTSGVDALPDSTKSAIREAVETFSDFTPGNDPYGEGDFGKVEVDGYELFWKIDYYDPTYRYGSEDPADPSKTRRVLTIMLTEDY